MYGRRYLFYTQPLPVFGPIATSDLSERPSFGKLLDTHIARLELCPRSSTIHQVRSEVWGHSSPVLMSAIDWSRSGFGDASWKSLEKKRSLNFRGYARVVTHGPLQLRSRQMFGCSGTRAAGRISSIDIARCYLPMPRLYERARQPYPAAGKGEAIGCCEVQKVSTAIGP